MPDRSPVSCVAAGSHVIDADCHHITTAELAVDSEIEEGKVAKAVLKLKARSDAMINGEIPALNRKLWELGLGAIWKLPTPRIVP